jgi:hypothetical protein
MVRTRMRGDGWEDGIVAGIRWKGTNGWDNASSRVIRSDVLTVGGVR